MSSRAISPKSTVCSRREAAGFTLLELLTVMAIMFILMGMSSLALRGLVRGAGISGAVSNVRAVLTQARQQAIMQQHPTAVFFKPDGATTNTMQILVSYGRVASTTSGKIGFMTEDGLPWSPGDLNGSEVFNFRGGDGKFKGGSGDTYVTDFTWRVSDDVAFQIGAIRQLPEGILFSALPDPPIVVFEADGSAREAFEIELVEISAPPGALGMVVSVDETTGWITVDEPGAKP